MEAKTKKLSSDQIDILAEVFNMGMGQSANAISALSGVEHEVFFGVPDVDLLTREEFLNLFSKDTYTGMIVQNYYGELEGKALMFYPELSGKELARILIGSDLPADQIEVLESDALTEVGNIFINSSLACLGNFLDTDISTEIPQIVYNTNLVSDFFWKDNQIIHLNAPFQIEHLDISGMITFVVDNGTTKRLLEVIDKLLEE